MQIIVRANARQQEEWMQKEGNYAGVHFIDETTPLPAVPADTCIDLLYGIAPPLDFPHHTTVMVNSVINTCSQLPEGYLRINAWPGFLQRPLAEIAVAGPGQQQQAAELMDTLGWAYELVPDISGMITARIVATIINEAYFALGEGVSTKTGIDTAMKLGTNYPFGPFEWAGKIGLEQVYRLLQCLGAADDRYQPAPALLAEINAVNQIS